MSHVLEHPGGDRGVWRSRGANARMRCRVFEEMRLVRGIGSVEKVLKDWL